MFPDNIDENNPYLNQRNIIFFIMVFAIGASLYFSSGSTRPVQEKLNQLADKTSEFQMRVLLAQVLTIPEGIADDTYNEQISFLFESLEGSPLTDKEKLDTQKYIVMSYLGKKSDFPGTVTGNLRRELELLYLENTPLETNDPEIFRLPLGDLSRLQQLSLQGNKSEYDNLLSRLKNDSFQLMMILQAVFFILFFLFVAGIVILYMFIKNKGKLSHFAPMVEMIPAQNSRLLLETAVLYLFFMFPVTSYILMSFPEINVYYFHISYIPVIFALSLLYYWKNAQPDPYLKMFLFGIARVNILKEIFFGLVGFTAMFPVAILSLFLGLGMMDGPDIRFAHPVAFAIKDHPVLIFILAVILAPVTEEVIFRAFFYGFFRKYLRIHQAAIVTGSIFAILHPQGMGALLYLTVIGGGLAVLREFREGLIAPVTAHMLINLIATVTAYQFWL